MIPMRMRVRSHPHLFDRQEDAITEVFKIPIAIGIPLNHLDFAALFRKNLFFAITGPGKGPDLFGIYRFLRKTVSI